MVIIYGTRTVFLNGKAWLALLSAQTAGIMSCIPFADS